MSQPLVHVLVINWNGREHLQECFDSLVSGDYGNARFVLIDNASTDGSIEFVRGAFGHDARVEILEMPENLGWSRGNDAGIERAMADGADYVFLLNNDTATAPDAISKLVQTAELHPEIGALAPKMLLYDYPSILNSIGLECSIIASSWDLGIGRLDDPRWDTPRRVIGACGGAAFFRVAALRRAGILPMDFDMYLDDLDLGLRIWNAGSEVWSCPEARVRHKFSATMGRREQQRRKYYLNTRNRLYVILRNFPVGKLPWVFGAYCIGEMRAIGRALLDGAPWRVAAHVRAWFGGVAYLPRALRERMRRRRAGQSRCRFWPMIRSDCMFFWGVEFPRDGWYAPRTIRGQTVRPMSDRAVLQVAAGRLRVAHVNCYPLLGNTCVEVAVNGKVVSTLATSDCDETILEVPAGALEFTARRVFSAEETGAPVDLGGWISAEPV